ncbi:hypothetical protein [Sphingomonas sp. TX0522]|uniref:hypothetical protein n=1 Tax=Sphingomonas sp. TX0522 TaxID=2479205 RepID=UPI0018DF9552|nr:hypothetical protein [Sphingomonas sp. TX0522]MBI0530264.1 hypothetical protein [Sphingomonas sp. TX0522]
MFDFTHHHDDLLLRVTGLLSITVGVAALWQLYTLVHLPPHHEASAIELVLAAIGFLGMSAGSALVALGRHIFDEVIIARPWGHAASFELPTKSGSILPPTIEHLSAPRSYVAVTPELCWCAR